MNKAVIVRVEGNTSVHHKGSFDVSLCIYIYIYIDRVKAQGSPKTEPRSSKFKGVKLIFTAFYSKFLHMSMSCSMTFHIFLRGRNWMSSAQDVLQKLYFKTFNLCV